MDLAEIRTIALGNQRSLTLLDAQCKDLERRVLTLEASNNVMLDVQLAMKELTMSNKRIDEKLQDMKVSIEKINEESKERHNDMNLRLKKLEDQPGEKWNKATWLVIAALVSAAAGIAIGKLFI